MRNTNIFFAAIMRQKFYHSYNEQGNRVLICKQSVNDINNYRQTATNKTQETNNALGAVE